VTSDSNLTGGEFLWASDRYTPSTDAPELTVSWTNTGVSLEAPQVLHSNGAELVWDPPLGSTITQYQVYRSGILIATIGDPAVTHYRDTTGIAGQTYTYKITTGSVDSNTVSVSLPSSGSSADQAAIQSGPTSGISTYTTQANNCANYGAQTSISVDGGSTGAASRAMLLFDLRSIPSSATVQSASLTLTRSVGHANPVEAHRIASDWVEGTDTGACNDTGAAWKFRSGKVKWGTDGADYDSTVSGTPITPGTGAGTDVITNLGTLVQAWLNGSQPNFGLLLKYTNESTIASNNQTTWYSDDASTASQRPLLTVTYTDSPPQTLLNMNVSQPAPSSVVSGSSVPVTVTIAGPDGPADVTTSSIQLYANGVLQTATFTHGSGDTYTTNWDSHALTGSQSLVVKATDNRNGTVMSAPTVTVTAGNSAAPTVAAPSVSGSGSTRTVSTTASDDVAVTKVEFYVDGSLFGTATASPWQASLDYANFPVYDGSHTLVAKAYDADGHVTTSSSTPLTVSRTSGTEYQAQFTVNTAVPQEMVVDPSNQLTYPLSVTVKNLSSSTWSSSNVWVRYRWIWVDDNPTQTITDGPQVGLGGSVAPNGTATVQLSVTPPTSSTTWAAYQRGLVKLEIDLYDSSTSTWFANQGNQPSDQYVTVNNATTSAAGLGLERFWAYTPLDTGAGQVAVNAGNGNLNWQQTLSSEPGRGLDTVVDLTYNSLQQHSASPVGNNFLLDLSDLIPLGLPLDIHPNASDTLASRTTKWIGFTDADGTLFRFTGATAGDGTVYYSAPAGVHLYLRQYSTTDTTKWWALTRPDRTTFFFDQTGYPTSVADANGNTLTFTLTTVAAGDDAYGFVKQVTKVSDAGGRDLTLAYYTAATAPYPWWRGKLKTMTDHVGHVWTFAYYVDGNLLSVTEAGGTNPDGTYLPDRSTVFDYTTYSGTAAALSTLAGRKAPDPTTPQSSRLYSVIDPRQNETSFAYNTTGTAWTLASFTDRAANQTSFTYTGYPSTSTTVAAPLSRSTVYAIDNKGRPTSITDPIGLQTQVSWTSDNEPNTVTEPTGKTKQYTYNQNGYLTDEKDELGDETSLTYQNVAVDTNDVTGKWETGRTIPHSSQLVTKDDPLHNVTGGMGHEWTFDYDTSGNLLHVTNPLSKVTTYTYNGDGTVATVKDANNHTTTYNTYDNNGLPTKVTDAAGGVWQAHYLANGLQDWVQDANHGSLTGGDPTTYRTENYYDPFGRLTRSSQPKSTTYAPGLLIWTETGYDANDSPTTAISPHYELDDTDGSSAITATTTYDAMDRATLVDGLKHGTASEQTRTTYDAAGRVTKVEQPKGVATPSPADDYATLTTYTKDDQVATTTKSDSADSSNNQSEITTNCYDKAGDLRWVIAPKGYSSTFTCPDPTAAFPVDSTAPSYTAKYHYDDAHRKTSTVDPLGNTTSTVYDANGNAKSTTDANGNETDFTYDDANQKTKQVAPFDPLASPARTLKTEWVYDAVGNQTKLISPRAYDASPDGGTTFSAYVTTYTYDALNRLTQTTYGGGAYASEVMGDGPLAYYRLGEASGTTANDETQNTGNALTYRSTFTLAQTGALTGDPNTAVNFTGGDAKGVKQPTGQAFSLEMWVKWSGTGSGTKQALFLNGKASTEGFALELNHSGTSNHIWYVPFGSTALDTGYTLPSGQWVHLTLTADHGSVVFYVGGNKTYTGSTGNPGSFVSGDVLSIASENASNPFNGQIDEVSVYDHILTAARVLDHDQAGQAQANTYTYQSFDPNGNLASMSLPTLQSDPSKVPANEQTQTTYWDNGQIYDSSDGFNPKIRFDYTAEGWQNLRVPETALGSGVMDWTRSMQSDYYPDGKPADTTDLGGQRTITAYDQDGNQTSVSASGVSGVNAVAPQDTGVYDGLDRLTTVKQPKVGTADTLNTSYAYDLSDNVVSLDVNAEYNGSSQVVAGRTQTFTYDNADQPLTQVDDYATTGASDDSKWTLTYNPDSTPNTRTYAKNNGSGGWTTLQTQTQTYFANQLIKELKTVDANNTILQDHQLSYTQGGIYQDGNPVHDTFVLDEPRNVSCDPTACTSTWYYDARDRLTTMIRGTGDTDNYQLDAIGNITQQDTSTNITTNTYNGQQLTSTSTHAGTTNYIYDSSGNLACQVSSSWTQSSCPAAGNTNLQQDYEYDYRDRLQASHTYSSGTQVDETTYSYDGLDRPITKAETPQGSTTTTVSYLYLGLTNVVSQDSTPGTGADIRNYVYDHSGSRLLLDDNDNSNLTNYSYIADQHGDVVLLQRRDTGAIDQSYGYDAYGNQNAQLTSHATGVTVNNDYTYEGKRSDTATGTLDMGARTYSASFGRFLQQDMYFGALADLGLSEDPLTSNRYALAGGNPVSFVESDGHFAAAVLDGGPSSFAGQGLSAQVDLELLMDAYAATTCTGVSENAACVFLRNVANRAAVRARLKIAWGRGGPEGIRIIPKASDGTGVAKAGPTRKTSPSEVVPIPWLLGGESSTVGLFGWAGAAFVAGLDVGILVGRGGNVVYNRDTGETPTEPTPPPSANDIIAAGKKGSIRREFPSEYLDKTLPEIQAAARKGDASARRALKLLTDNRFNK
jgi:RHS repeat-associated protein